MMTTAIKKKNAVFSKTELEIQRKVLIKERFGLIPIEVRPEGFYYDGKETIEKIRNMRTQGKRP